VSDDDGGSQTATWDVTIKAAELQADPVDPTKTALVVGGTSGNDTITFYKLTTGVQVVVNGVSLGTFNPTGRVIAYGQAGDDTIRADGTLTLAAELYGGDGNDNLTGGGGRNLLAGGDGNDSLIAGSLATSRNVMIGGRGADTLTGMGGDDLLVGGRTAYDDNPTALRAILEAWSRTDQTYAQRTAALRTGTFYNGSVRLDAHSVLNDQSADSLSGNAGTDWFWFSTGDTVKDKATAETADQVF
jgi:Ca2+-binding RTX toxin-like protein